MPYRFSATNNAVTTLAGNLIASATSAVVNDLPGAMLTPCVLTIWDRIAYPDPADDPDMEIVHCTASIDAEPGPTTLTLVRAREGTSDVYHAAGQTVAILHTAGIANDARDADVGFARAVVVDRVHDLVTAAANIRGLWLFGVESGTTISDLALDSGHTAHDATLSADASTLIHRWDGDCGNLALGPTSTTGYFGVADHVDFTFGEPQAFSLVVLVNPAVITSRYLLAKYDLTAGVTKREWVLSFDASGYLQAYLRDQSNGYYIGRAYQSSLAADIGSWHTYIMTYSGSGISSGVKLYRDGAKPNVDNANVESGAYVAMEDTAAVVGNFAVGSGGTPGSVFGGRYGLVLIVGEELTQTQVTRLDRIVRAYAGVTV